MWVLWGFDLVSPSSWLNRLQAHLPSLGLFVWLRDSLAPEKCPAAESTQQTFCIVCSHRGHRRDSAQLARRNREGLKWPGYKVRRESDPQFVASVFPPAIRTCGITASQSPPGRRLLVLDLCSLLFTCALK